MKIKSNKSSYKSSVKSNKPEIGQDMSEKPRYTVEEISNGFILEKSYTDKSGKYCCVKTYHETNPLEEESDEKE